MKRLTILAITLLTSFVSAKVKVAALSPLLADLARQIGGDKVEVIDIIGDKGNPHSFTPTTKTLNHAAGAQLFLASGKGIEPYLPKLKSLVGNSATILDMGKNIRSLHIEDGTDGEHSCCDHHHGVTDPHWWHSIENWRRASSTLATELAKIDPENKDYYKTQSKTYRSKLSKLKAWANKQLATIPKQSRKLATAHAAFGYFCHEFGFQPIPIRGLNSEQAASPKKLKLAIAAIKKNKVKAIFPDESTNPKALQAAATAAGVKLASPLYADSHDSIEDMFRHNVTTIVDALK